MKDLVSHIIDIVQNSIRAKADRIEIDINESRSLDRFTIEIRDNGCGMNKDTLARVREPYFTNRTSGLGGLGIPLLQHQAEQTGGWINITSVPGQGSTIIASFTHSHINRPPLGDISETISLLLAIHPEIRFIYHHTTDRSFYTLDAEEVKKTLDGVPCNHPDIRSAIQTLIRENLAEIEAENRYFH